MNALLRIEAPTDAQLDFVARLCNEHGYPQPAVYSKLHAGLLIDAIQAGQYCPPEWNDDFPVDGDPGRFGADAYAEDVPF